MHVKEIALATFVVFSAGKVTCLPTANNGQGDVYHLNAVADVWLEGSFNKNYYSLLLLGAHASYRKKRSLLRFDDIPCACKTINYASMYIYYSHSFKAEWQNITEAPFISQMIQAHRVLKSWNETQLSYSVQYIYIGMLQINGRHHIWA